MGSRLNVCHCFAPPFDARPMSRLRRPVDNGRLAAPTTRKPRFAGTPARDPGAPGSLDADTGSGSVLWNCPTTELLGILSAQPLPAELHRLTTSDAADGCSAEKAIQNIESNVPARGAPRDEAAIDVVPQRQARAATKGFEFPPGIVVLKHLGSVSSRHSCFDRRGRSHPGKLHRSSRTQAPIDFKGSPLVQMRWVG